MKNENRPDLHQTTFIWILSLLSFFISSCGGQTLPVPAPEKPRHHRTGLSETELKKAANSPVPTSMVRNVRKAKNGDILIASYVGVYRYDGKTFTNLTKDIGWPTFWDVLEDKNGNLWMASQDSGLYSYDGKSFRLYSNTVGQAGSSALHLYEDRTGNIWAGSIMYDGASIRNLGKKDGFPNNNIRLLLEDNTGKQWFGAQGEDLFVFDGKTYTVLKNSTGNPFKNVWSVIQDQKGLIWFGDNEGLWRYDGNIFTHVSKKGAYGIIQDKKGNLWTTGLITPPDPKERWSLTRYDQQSLYSKNPTATEITSSSPALLGLVEADDGSIWFGSMTGVYRYDGTTITDFKVDFPPQ